MSATIDPDVIDAIAANADAETPLANAITDAIWSDPCEHVPDPLDDGFACPECGLSGLSMAEQHVCMRRHARERADELAAGREVLP